MFIPISVSPSVFNQGQCHGRQPLRNNKRNRTMNTIDGIDSFNKLVHTTRMLGYHKYSIRKIPKIAKYISNSDPDIFRYLHRIRFLCKVTRSKGWWKKCGCKIPFLVIFFFCFFVMFCEVLFLFGAFMHATCQRFILCIGLSQVEWWENW